MPRCVWTLVFLVGLLVAACVAAIAVSDVAYETKDGITLKLGKYETSFAGQAPEFSPDGGKLGFFREGNVYVLNLHTWKCRRVTDHPAQEPLDWYFRLRLRWHPSGRAIAYTRVDPFDYIADKQIFEVAKAIKHPDDDTPVLSSIWVVNLNTRQNWRAVNLRGRFAELVASCQPEGASVYEPFFSPDGKYLCFVNAGSLFEQPFTDKKPAKLPKAKAIAWTGALDYCTGGSKSGQGIRELDWDARHQRVCYWVGRFWGMSENEFGYVPWVNGKWGHAQEWDPGFAGKADDETGNNRGCAIDAKGRLWVKSFGNPVRELRWTRYDGRAFLPAEAGNPAFR